MAKYTVLKLTTGDDFALDGPAVQAVEQLGRSHVGSSGLVQLTTRQGQTVFVNPAAIAVAEERDDEPISAGPRTPR